MSYIFSTKTLEISIADTGDGWSALLSEVDEIVPWPKWRHWEALGKTPQKAIGAAVLARAQDIGEMGYTATRDLAAALISIHNLIYAPPPATERKEEA